MVLALHCKATNQVGVLRCVFGVLQWGVANTHLLVRQPPGAALCNKRQSVVAQQPKVQVMETPAQLCGNCALSGPIGAAPALQHRLMSAAVRCGAHIYELCCFPKSPSFSLRHMLCGALATPFARLQKHGKLHQKLATLGAHKWGGVPAKRYGGRGCGVKGGIWERFKGHSRDARKNVSSLEEGKTVDPALEIHTHFTNDTYVVGIPLFFVGGDAAMGRQVGPRQEAVASGKPGKMTKFLVVCAYSVQSMCTLSFRHYRPPHAQANAKVRVMENLAIFLLYSRKHGRNAALPLDEPIGGGGGSSNFKDPEVQRENARKSVAVRGVLACTEYNCILLSSTLRSHLDRHVPLGGGLATPLLHSRRRKRENATSRQRVKRRGPRSASSCWQHRLIVFSLGRNFSTLWTMEA